MKQDPDDLKIPHQDINSLMQAFELAWQQLGYDKKLEKEHEHEQNK